MAQRENNNNPALVFQQLKARLHEQIVSSVDFARRSRLGDDALREELRAAVMQLCSQRSITLPAEDREYMIQEIMNEVFGFGPLQPLMNDQAISDILVNGCNNVFVERDGILHATDVRFSSNETLLTFIQRLATRVGRRIDESSPMVDVRLSDGSRLNAIVPPLSLRGPTLSIRRFKSDPLRLEDIVSFGTMAPEMAKFLSTAVAARCNMMISGATGTGKTTLLNSLSRFIPHSERVITLEHTAELQLQQPDVVALEARPPNVEGKGEVPISDLLKNTLRMRPDRIIVGECRGAEVFDVLQAMLTGHDGSMSTIHAGDTREALQRMELMIALSQVDLPVPIARTYIASAVRLLVHMRRFPTGERKIIRISELCGYEDGKYIVKDLFEYRSRGTDSMGRMIGAFHALGYVPELSTKIGEAGFELPEGLFAERELGAKGAAAPAS